MNIQSVHALEILDSRGNPTIKAYIELEDGTQGVASVPSGASTGKYEALELRDGNPKYYSGRGVKKSVDLINSIIDRELSGKNIEDLAILDRTLIDLDGTENKSRLGANATLSVSLACARTLSLYKKEPLWKTLNTSYFSNGHGVSFPRIMVNLINGGAHAGWNLDIQEFMIIPKTPQPSDAIRTAAEIFYHLKEKIIKEYHTSAVGDEGGFSPNFRSLEQAIQAIEGSGYQRHEVDVGLDIAASELYKAGEYVFAKEHKTFSADELTDFYLELHKKYNIYSFEDPFAEDDWKGFQRFTEKIGNECLVVADDLVVTNTSRIRKAIAEKAAQACIIKPNQIGTVYETVQAIRLTQEADWKVVISHRSGDTDDSFIADLAYACGADFIKTGSMSRYERLAKYNRLLEIEAFEV